MFNENVLKYQKHPAQLRIDMPNKSSHKYLEETLLKIYFPTRLFYFSRNSWHSVPDCNAELKKIVLEFSTQEFIAICLSLWRQKDFNRIVGDKGENNLPPKCTWINPTYHKL